MFLISSDNNDFKSIKNNDISLTAKMISIRFSSKSGLSQNGFTNRF
jgi:hypothetical protein